MTEFELKYGCNPNQKMVLSCRCKCSMASLDTSTF